MRIHMPSVPDNIGAMRLLIPLLLTLLGAAGCVSLPKQVGKHESYAIDNPETTSVGRIAASVSAAANAANPDGGRNLSGVRLLSSGAEALASLVALADRAERTIDIQQYIVEDDDSARFVLRHVRRAAERGVRVRMLIDDLNTVGFDRRYLRLSERGNIEVRLFNPFPGGRLAFVTRFISSAADIPRINHRMHNKLFIADGALAITGGRNIGDQYYTRDKATNFLDLDVLAAGPVVPELSASFDDFWNSDFAFPIASLAAPDASAQSRASTEDPPLDAAAQFLAKNLAEGKLDLLWVPVAVLADRPAKIAGEDTAQEETISADIAALMQSATAQVTIISPYFVPGRQGVELMSKLVARGVHVSILTNSLATTDSPLVHIGYSRYRLPLLKIGAELHEMRPQLGQKRPRFHPFRYSHASLHAKAIVIDHRSVFIGSMNMDERSARTNSELGLVIRSAALARQVEGLFDDLAEDGSYTLQLRPGGNSIEWSAGAGAERKIWHTDPETSLLRRLWITMLSPVAPDELL
jgi:cardiolipin synthase C